MQIRRTKRGEPKGRTIEAQSIQIRTTCGVINVEETPDGGLRFTEAAEMGCSRIHAHGGFCITPASDDPRDYIPGGKYA